MNTEEHLQAIRADLPATMNIAYLNTGSVGPLPRPTVEVLANEIQREFHEGRAHPSGFDRFMAGLEELRGEFARLLGADEDEVALTHHTTEGMNIGSWGLNWRPGDEVVVTNLEHEGGLLPAYSVAQRFGLDVRVADLGLGDDPDVVLDALDRAITPRTRLLNISHVSWATGAALPVQEIVEHAHRRGVLVLVDAAQSAGAIPVDVHALGVDFYAVPGQKWLCGPEGMGALYVRRDRVSLLNPTYMGFFSLLDPSSWTAGDDLVLNRGARRYEVGSRFRPGIFAMIASLRWLRERVGWQWAFQRIHQLAAQTRAALHDVPGATVLMPQRHAGLVACMIDGADAIAVVEALRAENIIIRYVPWQGRYLLRVSTGFYNTEDEIRRVRDGVVSFNRLAAEGGGSG